MRKIRRALKSIRKEIKWGLIFILICIIVSALIDIIYKYPFIKGLRAFLGFAYVLFLPGFVLVRAFFNKVDVVEKVALSFGLSIALVIISVLFSNMVLRIPITALTNFLVILVVIIIILVIKYYEKPIKRFFSKINEKIKYSLPRPLRKLFY